MQEYRKSSDYGALNGQPAGKTIDLDNIEEKSNSSFKLKDKIKYFFLRNTVVSISKLAAFMPEKHTYKFCVSLTMLAYRRFPKFKNLARRHLEIAFGKEKSPEEIDAILKQTYINYGKNLAEFLMIPHKTPEWIESKVRFNDPNWIIRSELNKGKGVIGLGGHFGSWELIAARLGLYKYPLVAVVKAQRDSLFSKFVMDTRTKWGNEYIFRVHGVREECISQLSQNKILGLMADQNATRGGLFVDFFGKKAATVTGPAYIAMKTGAAIVPSFPARNEDGTVTMHVMPPIKLKDTGNFDEDLLYNVQLCAKAVEDFARRYPAEYFWWHKRWKTRPEDEQPGE